MHRLKKFHAYECSTFNDRNLIPGQNLLDTLRQMVEDSNLNPGNIVVDQMNFQSLSRNVTWRLSEVPKSYVEPSPGVCIIISAETLVGACCICIQQYNWQNWKKRRQHKAIFMNWFKSLCGEFASSVFLYWLICSLNAVPEWTKNALSFTPHSCAAFLCALCEIDFSSFAGELWSLGNCFRSDRTVTEQWLIRTSTYRHHKWLTMCMALDWSR